MLFHQFSNFAWLCLHENMVPSNPWLSNCVLDFLWPLSWYTRTLFSYRPTSFLNNWISWIAFQIRILSCNYVWYTVQKYTIIHDILKQIYNTWIMIIPRCPFRGTNKTPRGASVLPHSSHPYPGHPVPKDFQGFISITPVPSPNDFIHGTMASGAVSKIPNCWIEFKLLKLGIEKVLLDLLRVPDIRIAL